MSKSEFKFLLDKNLYEQIKKTKNSVICLKYHHYILQILLLYICNKKAYSDYMSF